MNKIVMIALGLIIAAYTVQFSASTSAQACELSLAKDINSGNSVIFRVPDVPGDTPELDCQQLCDALASAEADLAEARVEVEAAIWVLLAACTAADQTESDLGANLAYLQTLQAAADQACLDDPFGEACLEALRDINTQRGVVASARARNRTAQRAKADATSNHNDALMDVAQATSEKADAAAAAAAGDCDCEERVD